MDGTHVDDEEILVQANSNDELIERAGKVIDTVSHVFGRNAVVLHWDPGKSEFLGVLNGAQTRAVKRTISQNDGSTVSSNGVKCHVAQVQKHVGTQITSACNDTVNVQCRLVKGKQAFRALVKRCFASREVDVGRKVDVFRCLIMSILLPGAETWTGRSWASLRNVNTFVLASLRRKYSLFFFGT